MMTLSHPNIVQLFEVIETQETFYLVTEYASEGEMFEYLLGPGHIEEKQACGKFHQGPRPENLLLDADLNVKIVDFGSGNKFTCGNKLDTFCGSPPYTAWNFSEVIKLLWP
ncbi:hypothetical protein HPG69_008698 [Diceros bicornis minor]|uniref:non-specific serine/threonine protein kinase n=1 Tax=Diceros bicornis minor TaxID=77932 RepID=A0A7J7FAB9_DICBM|nr:hypothetical protein HPG69_008698 [Diceros bicornis minor]